MCFLLLIHNSGGGEGDNTGSIKLQASPEKFLSVRRINFPYSYTGNVYCTRRYLLSRKTFCTGLAGRTKCHPWKYCKKIYKFNNFTFLKGNNLASVNIFPKLNCTVRSNLTKDNIFSWGWPKIVINNSIIIHIYILPVFIAIV